MNKTLQNLLPQLGNLSEQELQYLENQAKEKLDKSLESQLKDYPTWVRLVWRNGRGEPLDFENHKYLKQIYEDQFPNIVYTKAAQCGLSERMVSEAVWVAEQLGKVVLYTFPASSQLQDFTQARLDPVFQNSEYLKKVYKDSDEGVQKIELKKVGKGYIYLRGSQNEKQIISIDADALYLDERDRFIEKSVPFIDKRTLHSDLRWRREASTPTIPGFGIHASYMNSDQRVWQVPCPKCGQYQEIDLFKNVDHDLYICFCEFCKKENNETVEIDRFAEGKWAILNPEKTSECHGYKISGLYNPKRTIKEIVTDYQKAFNESVSSIEQFYNQTLGMPFHVEGQRISEENLDGCKRDYQMPVQVQGAIAGCDVGSVNNMVVAVPMAKDRYRVVWAGTVTEFFGPVDSIESVMNRFNVKMLVIDAAPERRKVKELIEKFPGRVFAAEYPTKKFTIDNYIMWDDVSHEVKLDRTISLDYLVSDIQNQRFELPSNIDFVENFYTQMTSSVRVTLKNARTGEPVSKWVEEKADHYFHAFNYCRIALSRGTAGQALLDYYKAPEAKKSSIGSLARFIAMNGRKIF